MYRLPAGPGAFPLTGSDVGLTYNEVPDGGVVEPFFADDFEAYTDGQAVQGEGDGAFAWGATNNNAPSSVSTDIARTGTKSLKFPAPQGIQYNNEVYMQLGRQVTEIWLEWWMYYPTGNEGIPGVGKFQHGTDGRNDKFLRIWGGGDNNNCSTFGASRFPLGSNGDAQYGGEARKSCSGMSESFVTPGPKFDMVTDDYRGRWVRFRWYGKNAGSTNTGVMKVWWDDVLSLSESNWAQGTTGATYWDEAYIMGAANSGSPNDSAYYIDDIKFYDSDPGWE